MCLFRRELVYTLSLLFSGFDTLCDRHGVFKVVTIGARRPHFRSILEPSSARFSNKTTHKNHLTPSSSPSSSHPSCACKNLNASRARGWAGDAYMVVAGHDGETRDHAQRLVRPTLSDQL